METFNKPSDFDTRASDATDVVNALDNPYTPVRRKVKYIWRNGEVE
jgi:hypothetical protein